jgi:hypothetical protein
LSRFIARYRPLITGAVSGFDRLVFRGSLLPLFRAGGMFLFLERTGVRLLDFKEYVSNTSERVKEAALAEARRRDRPVRYLESSKTDKEKLAKRLVAEQPVERGLIGVLTAVEPCMSFEYHRSPNRDERGLRLRPKKCLHLYKYLVHPQFGFMSARLQTWFPFNIQICLNGREWLARQLRRRRSDFKRADNCFTWLRNVELAQRLLSQQLQTDWPAALDAIARSLNPLHSEIFKAQPMEYYWSGYQTEWATDILFKEPRALAGIYPALVRHAVEHFKSPDVMRFLGGKVHGNFTGEIITSFKDRPEGVRVKHWVRGNSVKMYDKAGSVLRVETTIARARDFKVFRRAHNDPQSKLDWRPLRKGVADLHRRAQLSQRSNDAYLDALSAVEDTTPCAKLFDAVSRPVFEHNRRFRALRLNDAADLALLDVISRGEFATAGFRNRDIRSLIHHSPINLTAPDIRRLSAKTSRQLRLLRAHGVIKKISKTHRYRLTPRGQLLTAALHATRRANIKVLLEAA